MDRLEMLIDNTSLLVSSGYYGGRAGTPGPSLVNIFGQGDRFPIIAEVKMASPSQARISSHSPERLVDDYRSAGAAALSVLTEPNLFRGSLENLDLARTASLPVMMKDIVISPAQLTAGAMRGASAVLLIQEVFSSLRLEGIRDGLIERAHALGLEVVLEAGSSNELLAAADSRADVLAINQRDLRTFHVDPDKGRSLLPLVCNDVRPVIVMSGIDTRSQVRTLRDAGASAVLVGSSLSSSADPAEALRALVVPR